MVKYLESESVSVRDGGLSEELKFLLTCLTPSTSPWKTVTRVLKNYSIYEGYQDYIEDKPLKRAIRFYHP